uniref:Uncharacterized protein n=1 Tax=Candidozyma auris TaxID=498019 RepID=A0A0L0P1G0_CANAR
MAMATDAKQAMLRKRMVAANEIGGGVEDAEAVVKGNG